MDFNINNETFSNAYKCLKEANMLLQKGLGNFNDLEGSALGLIGKSGISNVDRLNNSDKHCSELKNKMYRTIESLATIDVESADYFSDILGSGYFIDNNWDGTRLNAPMGFNANGPSGSETWYDLNMSAVIKNMEEKYGYSDLEYNVRGDGVKVLSGVTPDGDRFENLVLVAADVKSVANPNGTFERGQIVETSLGMGIVADYCGRSASQRKSGGSVHFDIATAWHTGKYMSAAYSKDPYNVSNEHFEQIVPGQSVGIVGSDMCNNVDDNTFTSVGVNSFLNGKEVLLGDDTDIKVIFNPETYVSPAIPNSPVQSSDVTSIVSMSEDPIVTSNNVHNDGVDSNLQPKNNTDISHRGYTPGNIKDNSAEGFIQAGESGFWGCEADVRFDANGDLVCSHNTVVNGQTPTTFDEYLDICKEYGMTAIIDLKYEKGDGPADPNLSPAILKAIEEKGMIDSCILQTNNPIYIPYIRENSDDERICYLKDSISDNDLHLIQNNSVECVNILTGENNAYRIKRIVYNGVYVCVWNVKSETSKQNILNMGAKYVMSDNVLGITPYQEGDVDFNNINDI